VNARRLLVLIVLCVAVVPASSATATYPGAVGRIVFTSDRGSSSTSEVYSAAADGTDVKRLTWNNGFEQDPAWSPDGSHIAYESSDQDRFRIFVMNQDGSDQHVVSPGTTSIVMDWQPAWSPDGTQIAFASTRPTGNAWHIWVMNADGTNLHQLPGDLSQHPAWSPDGLRIAGDDGTGPLYIINADGTNERRLTTPPDGRYDEAPDWSPDGSSLVFSERTFGGASSALYAINADGAGNHQLTSGEYADYDPSWSPDGTGIVFRRRADASGYFQLYTVGAGGGAATQLLSSARNDMGPGWGSTTVSPTPSPPQAPRVDIFSPTATGFYWAGTTDHVVYTCSSDVSFVVSCIGSQPFGAIVDTSFAGLHHFSVTATDVEGRQTTETVDYTVLDFTRPTIQLRTPVDGGTYDVGENATVDFACSDGVGGSGIVYCAGTRPNGAPLDTTHIGSFTFQVNAVDGANNISTATATYRVVDRMPPAITITTPAGQAVYKQNQVVTADYTCIDERGGSGLASCKGNVAPGAAIDTSTAGDHTFTVTATDTAGNTATATRDYSVIQDRTPPSITITTPTGQAVYKQNQVVTADYTCTDEPGGSGLASCNGDVASGAAIDTSTVGDHTFAVTAEDGARNTASASSGYTVIYDFSGFFAPVAVFPTANPAKAGQGVPLKFSLHGNQGSDLFAGGFPAWVPCDSPAAASTTASGTLSYNASLDRYTFLAATDKAWAGTCKDVVITLRDGATHRARFAFGK
jgi:Tol biopolymer transport system component